MATFGKKVLNISAKFRESLACTFQEMTMSVINKQTNELAQSQDLPGEVITNHRTS